MEYAIKISGLSKKFGEKEAVKPMELVVEKGFLFSLLGVNGAGKTTTIRMLTGLTAPTAGDAWVCGHHIVKELPLVKKVSNVSTQDTAVAGNLTVFENLVFMAEIYGRSKADAICDADEMIKDFSMQEVKNSKAKTLSGGWQRRLSIAMALITKPEILFLDEPTLGLDVLARKELWKIIEGLKGKITMILTTHYMEEAQKLSDKVAVMVDGSVRAIGTVEELKERTGASSLEDAFITIAEEVRK